MSFDIFDRYATDENAENSGTWRDLGPGARVLVARAGNRAFTREIARLMEKHQGDLDANDEKSEALVKKIMVELHARTILLGWEGLSYKGKPIEYSQANAMLLLGHDDFRKEITRLSEERAAYKAKEEVAQGEA